MNNFSKKKFAAVFLLLCFAGCKPKVDWQFTENSGNLNFKHTVVFGSEYLGGIRDGALFAEAQASSVGALICKNFPGADPYLFPAMPAGDGLGLNFFNPGKMNGRARLQLMEDCNHVTSLFPASDTFGISSATNLLQPVSQSALSDFTVPYAKLKDYSDPLLGSVFPTFTANPFYRRFASAPGASTLLYDATQQSPTFIIAWPGMDDVMSYATHGGEDSLLSLTNFTTAVDDLLGQLMTTATAGVLANIPDPEDFPFFTTIPPQGLDLDSASAAALNGNLQGVLTFQIGKNGFVAEVSNGVLNTGIWPRRIDILGAGENILLSIPLDSLKCWGLGVTRPIPGKYILDSAELQTLRNTIDGYNIIIRQECAKYQLAVADMRSFYGQIKTGLLRNGITYSSEFIKGNFFSLDGLHPNTRGAAMLANEWINAIEYSYLGVRIRKNIIEQFPLTEFP